MRGTRGFVMLNALVIVAAMSAAVVLVMGRAQAVRDVQFLDVSVAQTKLYLDGFDALAVQLLGEDGRRGITDHPSDNWAKASYTVDVDRGQVSGQIRDLQSGFNINWLNWAPDVANQEAFLRLADSVSLSSNLAEAVIDFVKLGGPSNRAIYGQRPIPMDPDGGPLVSIWQLRDVPGMTDESFEKLRKYASVMPPEAKININTAPREVIDAILPNSSQEINGFLQGREQEPIASLDMLFDIIMSQLQDEVAANLVLEKFAVGSDWFIAESVAQLNDSTFRRETVIRRRGTPRVTEIWYRLGPL
ncbi:type II secretion system minor pseudopilin GspK [uncultured Litoreibacter sp.]|uniref:type II secretion system minor pseudopilin GspK n=1 Tax=uncultured Litoreibacter sp. TaxID=1392394 RepID=UPI002620A4E7|nr:type II secretion system minor pseudopilin GspK [uncultured Litoreibacter sp.]